MTPPETQTLLDEVRRLRAENDELRFQLANGAGPCIYCKLPADKMAECPAGFPGCGRADDLLVVTK
jgi:hypothetical protein